MKYRRVLAALLTAALAVGMLAGCSELTPRGFYLDNGEAVEETLEAAMNEKGDWNGYVFAQSGTYVPSVLRAGLPFITLRSNTAAALEEAIAESEEPEILNAFNTIRLWAGLDYGKLKLNLASAGGYAELSKVKDFDDSKWEEKYWGPAYFLIKVFSYDTKEALEESIAGDISTELISGLPNDTDDGYHIYILGAECDSKYYGIVLIDRVRED